MEGGGTEDRMRNSERFLRISSREAALEGLEKDGFKGVKGLDGGNVEVGLCCLRVALTSEEDWSWSWSGVVEKRWMKEEGLWRVRCLGLS